MKKNNTVMYQAIVTVTVFIIVFASLFKWMESLPKATPVKSVPVVVQPEKPGVVEKVGSFAGKTSKDFVKGLWRGIWD